MSRPKPQNPILALATLGVYFGLLLSGAAPQVLANAALTRQFDVKDEIEFSDDLDNKPDDERSSVSSSVQIHLEDVEYFLASLAELNKDSRFNANSDSFSVAQGTSLPYVDGDRAGRFTPLEFELSNESAKNVLDHFSRGMAYGCSLGDCVATSEFVFSAAGSKFDYAVDAGSITISVSVKKGSNIRAIDLARQLENTSTLYAADTSSKLRQAVIRNTLFTARNDQLLVVTRLPRAGLISLFNT